MSRFALLVFCLTVLMVSGAIKKWQPKMDFDDKTLWAFRRCKTNKIVFSDLKIPTILSQNVSTQEFILPENGIIVLPDVQHNLILNHLLEAPENCEDDNTAIFFGDSTSPFLDTTNWATIVDGVEVKQTTATPHREQVPCADDFIELPDNGSTFGMDFQYMSNLKFRGFKNYENFDIQRFLATELGQNVFYNSEDTIIEINNEPSDSEINSCYHKGDTFDNTNGILCHNMEKSCEVPLCLEPVRPIGHCCDICGAIIYVDLENENQKKNIKKIIERVTKRFNDDFENLWIHFHGSVVPKDGGTSIQMVLVDYDEYYEYAPEYAETLKKELFDLIYPSYKVRISKAGKPYQPNKSGHIMLFIFGCLFLVSMMFTIVCVAFDEKMQGLVNFNGIFRRHMFTSPFVFARFDNTDDNAEDGVTVGLDAAREINLQPNLGEKVMPSSSTGFNNPMYNKDDSKKLDNVKMTNVSPVNNANVDNDNNESEFNDDNTVTTLSNEETILVDVDLIEN